MKFTQKEEVFKDTVTSVCYTREFDTRGPFKVAIIDAPGKVTQFGCVLTPYGGHPLVDWDDVETQLAKDQKEKYGFVAARWGSTIVVSEEQFNARFVSLGELSKEIDLDRVVAHYEEENCDFSNRAWVAKSVTRHLQRMFPAMWACEIYTLLKDYLANTPKKPKS